MKKLFIILLIFCTKIIHAQEGQELYLNKQVDCKCKDIPSVSFNINLKIVYKTTGIYTPPDDKSIMTGGFSDDGILRVEYYVEPATSNISYNNSIIPISDITDFGNIQIAVDPVYADIYSKNVKINNIKIGIIDLHNPYLLKKDKIARSSNPISWKNFFNVESKEEVIRIHKQGFELRNFSYKLRPSNYSSLCLYLKENFKEETSKELQLNPNKETESSNINNTTRDVSTYQSQEVNQSSGSNQPDYSIQTYQQSMKEQERIEELSEEYKQALNNASVRYFEAVEFNSKVDNLKSFNSNSNSEEEIDNQYEAKKAEIVSLYNNEQNQDLAEFQQKQLEIIGNADNTKNAGTAAVIAGVGTIFMQNNAEQRKREALEELEENRRIELERIKAENKRREALEIERVWKVMNNFEYNFKNSLRKNLYDVTTTDKVYFYFGKIEKDKLNKTGTIFLSQIFPVYRYPDGNWPYFSDLLTRIKNIDSECIVRGYFLTKHEAENDKKRILISAQSSYIKGITKYEFNFNDYQGTGNTNTDFWGNEKSNKAKSSNTDFWGNEKNETKNKPDTTKTEKNNELWNY